MFKLYVKDTRTYSGNVQAAHLNETILATLKAVQTDREAEHLPTYE